MAAEMVFSALVQEAVSRGVSFGFSRREEKVSQGHLMERLEMAVSELELALERSAKVPITDISLLQRLKIIKRSYIEAMELLYKHKQLAMPAGPQQVATQGVKRKRWFIFPTSKSLKPFVALSTNDVRRFEWYADCAGKFVRDVESGCSLHHYTFCNPIVRHLLEGKTLSYYLEQGNLIQNFYIWPMYSDERGVEAVLAYHYEDSTMAEKCFYLFLALRLSESTNIVGVATKGLQLLTCGFKHAAEYAMGELALLFNLQDIVHSYGPPWIGIEEQHINHTQIVRPDPACCKGSRHGLCASKVSSEFADIFPEQVIYFCFHCHISALEPSSLRSSFDEVGRSNSRGGEKPPLLVRVAFVPHDGTETQDSYAVETIGDIHEYRDVSSIQQVAKMVKSDAINCFLHQPELTEYRIDWYSKHGAAWFEVIKASMEGAGAPETKEEVQGRSNRS